MSCGNHENHEILEFQYENYEHHEKLRIPCENHQNHENRGIHLRILKINEIIEFHTRITEKH